MSSFVLISILCDLKQEKSEQCEVFLMKCTYIGSYFLYVTGFAKTD